MFSKSLFGNSNTNKSILNPISTTTIPFYNNELKFSSQEYLKLNQFNELYDEAPLPQNFENYVDIINLLSNIEVKTKNENIKILLKITCNGLDVIMKNFGLTIDNIQLNILNLILQNRIDTIVSGKNDVNTIVSNNSTYSLEKQFTLSPVFSYYISIFGIPEEGKGFDLEKIQLIKTILETNSLNPYI